MINLRKISKTFFRKDRMVSSAEMVPLAQVNLGLRNMSVFFGEMRIKFQEIEQENKRLQNSAGEAWSEREAVRKDYYKAIDGILDVLDDCENILKSSPETLLIFMGLKRIIDEQGIAVINVKKGDVFDARFHKCEETIVTDEYPSGVVLQIIRKGYLQTRKDGTDAVIRSAKVHVSKSKDN